MIPNEEINLIRNKANIVDIISSYINLEPKGKNYFGVCPFHNDHNPSLSVSPEKQIYTCFVCGASGNVFSFVKDYENLTFPEAVKLIGIKIGHNVNSKISENKINREYYEIMNLANKYYLNNLKSKEGFSAKEYLNKRKITEETINEFNIGVSFNDNNLSKLLINKKYTEKQIIEIGLANKSENLYDVFRNRIIFPINNEKGEVIAFSGRIYNNEDTNKYVNSKESIIFKKSNILFNYDKAKSEAKKSKEIFIVEGFLDAIRMHIIGVKNVVATMGTALTKEHALLLKKLNVKIILLMDNDEAGEKSILAAGEELLKYDINVAVVRISGEKDPDDYIIKNGENKFKEVIKNPISFFDFKLLYFKKNKDLNKSKDLANYINTIINELNNVNDDILKEVIINNLNKEFGIDKNLLYSKLIKKEVKLKELKIIKKSLKLNKNKKISEAIIYMMMKDIKYIRKFEKDLGYIPAKEYGQIANDILAFYKINKTFNIADFITFESNNEYYETVLRIINNYEDNEPIYEEFDNYISFIYKWIKEEQINSLLKELKIEPDINRKQEINDLIIKLKRESENND
ncbi:MAG: DNA primase [Bacilli bacterium]|nr:DNA primase [Bacilli bacterium]MDD4406825.1 DNA primase [Bacilli bacterium]